MAKAKMDAMPVEVCGSCKFSHNLGDTKNLRCYVNPPVLIVDMDADGDVSSYRSCTVEERDPVCEKFKQRLHS